MNETIKKIINLNIGKVLLEEEMKNHTTMRVGGKVNALLIPNNIDGLILLIKLLNENNLKYQIIGRGSNLIFPDNKSDMYVIKIANILDDLVINDNEVIVGAGYSLSKLAKKISKQGLSGLEFAGGIPGTVGGATYMNAGAHLKSMEDIITYVKVLTPELEILKLSNKECGFSYRHSQFQLEKPIILEVGLKLTNKDKAQVFKNMAGNLEYRKVMQPLDVPSCGSTFRNPKDHHAGKLIEECGLKGHEIGGAKVSTKHANFIINFNEATSSDIMELVNYVITQVKNQTGITLQPEMEIIKEFDGKEKV